MFFPPKSTLNPAFPNNGAYQSAIEPKLNPVGTKKSRTPKDEARHSCHNEVKTVCGPVVDLVLKSATGPSLGGI